MATFVLRCIEFCIKARKRIPVNTTIRAALVSYNAFSTLVSNNAFCIKQFMRKLIKIRAI